MVGWKYVVANTLAEVEKLRNEVRDFHFIARSRNGDRVFAVKETSAPEEVKSEGIDYGKYVMRKEEYEVKV